VDHRDKPGDDGWSMAAVRSYPSTSSLASWRNGLCSAISSP